MGTAEHFLFDWTRSSQSEEEIKVCTDAYDYAYSFLTSMPSVAEKLASPKQQARLRRVITAVSLNVIDAQSEGKQLTVDAETLPAKSVVKWDRVSQAVWALEAAGQFHVAAIGDSYERLSVSFAPASDLGQQANAIKAQILNHSQPLDVHRWSDHPEANAFVDEIYAAHFEGGNAGIRKRHLKVVLLDLYVRWLIDPTLKTAVSLNVNTYDTDSRYNAIHLSKTTVAIVKHLAEVGLVCLAMGFQSHTAEGRVSRIWPTSRLVGVFATARFGLLDVGRHPDEELIVLRDQHPTDPDRKVEVEYEDDDTTRGMRDRLGAYNAMIQRTFVDIPPLELPFVELGGGHRLPVNQSHKLTRRVFNRGSFQKGGRFYGGWWQRCPEAYRTGIFLNDEATLEVDYSGLHIVMLYANKGIDYWREIGTEPYEVKVPGFDNGPVPRSICKLLLLVAINAKDETSAFQAFRSEAETGSPEKRISNGMLQSVLDGLRAKHSVIADYFVNDAGIDLMNQDGQITDRILSAFTEANIPILSIHDSYIVPLAHERKLKAEMRKAFAEVTGQSGVRVKPNRRLHPGNTKIGKAPSGKPMVIRLGAPLPKIDVEDVSKTLFSWAYPTGSPRYRAGLAAFRQWRS